MGLWIGMGMSKPDPLEAEFMRICTECGIKLERPERYPKGRPRPMGNIDFYLPDYKLGVEVKAWYCERMTKQLEGRQGIMVLIGIDAVKAFGDLVGGMVPF